MVGALVVLLLGLFVAKMARRWTANALKRTQLDKTLIPFVSHLVYYALLAFVLIAVLSLFGIPTTSFIAVLGAAGLAVGLALQGTLSNFAAGVVLLFFRPFKAGDFVEAAGEQGTVREVGVFATALRTLDLVNIVLPNASIWGATIKNSRTAPCAATTCPLAYPTETTYPKPNKRSSKCFGKTIECLRNRLR